MYNNLIRPNVSKQNSFHFIRLVCCLIVIYEHSVGLSGGGYLNLQLASTAVATFFILSGFWVAISLLHSESIKEYTIKRIKKIFPPYITVVIVFAVLLCAFSTLSPAAYFSNAGFWKYLVANLTTLNFLHTSLPGVFEELPLNGAVNGALWTIKIEIAFYIFLPIFLYLIDKLEKKNTRLIVLIGLQLISILYLIIVHLLCRIKPAFSPLENQFPAFLGYFACGITFALFWEKLNYFLRYLICPAFILIAILLFVRYWFLSAIMLPVALSIVVFWIATRLSFLGNIVTQDYSFGMYLVHFPIVMLFIQQGFFISCWTLAFLGVLGLSFTISYIMTRLLRG